MLREVSRPACLLGIINLEGDDGMHPMIKSILKLKMTDIYVIHFLQKHKKEIYDMLCRMNKTEALFGGAYKYYHLSELLDQYKPKSIVEFGSGFSTGVFAMYCKNNKAIATTYEHSEKWHYNTLRNLGELASFIQVKRVNYIEEKGIPPKTFYNAIIEEPVDFAYIDGPPLTENGNINGNVVNWDIVSKNDKKWEYPKNCTCRYAPFYCQIYL